MQESDNLPYPFKLLFILNFFDLKQQIFSFETLKLLKLTFRHLQIKYKHACNI